MESINRYVKSLALPAASAEAGALIRKIAQGVDRADELQTLLDKIRNAPDEQTGSPALPRRSTKLGPLAGRPDVALLRAHGIHIYGQQAALTIELDTLATDDGAPVEYTLLIEGTRKNGGAYDWTRKIPFQLTRRELPLVAAFILGYFSEKQLDFKYHGPANDKHLHLADQGCNLFVKLSQGGQALVAVPVEPADVYAWGELCMVALNLNRPTVSAEAQLALLRRIGQMPGLKRT
jgi:hypothetical protein